MNDFFVDMFEEQPDARAEYDEYLSQLERERMARIDADLEAMFRADQNDFEAAKAFLQCADEFLTKVEDVLTRREVVRCLTCGMDARGTVAKTQPAGRHTIWGMCDLCASRPEVDRFDILKNESPD